MKTVIDAVNEFKGEWPCSWLLMCQTNDLNKSHPNFKIKESTGIDVNDYHDHLCTKQEFNDLVSQMETNFGKCKLPYAEYKSEWEYVQTFKSSCEPQWLKDNMKKTMDKCMTKLANKIRSDFKSDKELEVMDIWKDAPKDAEYYQPNDSDYYEAWYKSVTANDYCIKIGGGKWQYCNYSSDALTNGTLIPRPQPKPVFTQEMCDNKILPPIGSKAQFIGSDDYLVEFNISDGDEVECICHTKDFEGESIGVYRHKDGYSVSILTKLIKPLTPPIELIDGKAYQFECNGEIINGCYNKCNELLYSAYKEYLVNLCTNIQPLTVEVK